MLMLMLLIIMKMLIMSGVDLADDGCVVVVDTDCDVDVDNADTG